MDRQQSSNLWEKDKIVLRNYRNCVNDFLAQVRAGEEVDWEDACSVEQGKLEQYMGDMVWMYKEKNPMFFDENRGKAFMPRLPYFQDF